MRDSGERIATMQTRDSGEKPNSIFSYLARGKSLGKKVDLLYDISHPFGQGSAAAPDTNLLEVKGVDEAAMNLQFTIVPPRIIPIDSSFTLDQAKAAVQAQSASGAMDWLANEQGNRLVKSTPLIAKLEWGVGGASIEKVEVDILNGCCVNLTASFLRAAVAVDPFCFLLTNFPGGASPALYELAAFIGPGYTKPNNAQRTIRFRSVAIPDGITDFGTTPLVPIPRMATRCRLSVAPVDDTDPNSIVGWLAQIVFFNFYNGGLSPNPDPTTWTDMAAVYTIADNGNGSGNVEIPNGATYAAVRHNNSFRIKPSLIFDLGI